MKLKTLPDPFLHDRILRGIEMLLAEIDRQRQTDLRGQFAAEQFSRRKSTASPRLGSQVVSAPGSYS